MSNAAHDIMVEALDFLGREVLLYHQSSRGFGGVLVYQGTLIGLDEDKQQLIVDNLVIHGGGSTVFGKTPLAAEDIIHIAPFGEAP